MASTVTVGSGVTICGNTGIISATMVTGVLVVMVLLLPGLMVQLLLPMVVPLQFLKLLLILAVELLVLLTLLLLVAVVVEVEFLML